MTCGPSPRVAGRHAGLVAQSGELKAEHWGYRRVLGAPEVYRWMACQGQAGVAADAPARALGETQYPAEDNPPCAHQQAATYRPQPGVGDRYDEEHGGGLRRDVAGAGLAH
jgi:hypothetical protein